MLRRGACEELLFGRFRALDNLFLSVREFQTYPNPLLYVGKQAEVEIISKYLL
jgi:hypothetical protein